MSDLTNKDAEQDTKIAVWGAGAIITAAITLIGIATAVDAKEINYGSHDSTQQEVVLQLSGS